MQGHGRRKGFCSGPVGSCEESSGTLTLFHAQNSGWPVSSPSHHSLDIEASILKSSWPLWHLVFLCRPMWMVPSEPPLSVHPSHQFLTAGIPRDFPRAAFHLPSDGKPALTGPDQQISLLSEGLSYTFCKEVWTPALGGDPFQFVHPLLLSLSARVQYRVSLYFLVTPLSEFNCSLYLASLV